MASKRDSEAATIAIAIVAAAVIGLALVSSMYESDGDASTSGTVALRIAGASDRGQNPAIKSDVTVDSTSSYSQGLSEPPLPQAPADSVMPNVWPPQGVAPTVGVYAMLAAGMAGDRGVMLATKAAIDAIPKPAVGDHNLAREKEKSALIAFKEGSYEAAIVRLNEAKKADPSDAELRTNLGYALIAYERLDDAKNVLVESIALDPGRGAAWVALGLVLAKQGDPDSAAAAFISSVAVSEPRMNSVEYFKALSKSDEDSGVKLAAAKALESRIVKEAATIAR